MNTVLFLSLVIILGAALPGGQIAPMAGRNIIA